MRSSPVRLVVVLSLLVLTAATGSPATRLQQVNKGNKVEVTIEGTHVGHLNVSVKLTPATGWKTDGAKLTVIGPGGPVGDPIVVPAKGNFSRQFKLPAGAYVVIAEGLFRKGNEGDRPTAKAGGQVR